MFGDIFDTAEELLSGEKDGQLLTSWERLPRNCADKLTLPEIPRKAGYPIGLKNQGATCYLNSLFQILFHTPELRKLLLQLPLCLQNTETPSGFVSEARHNFLLGFQRLFSEMSACDQKSVGTEYLNKAFGWEKAQHLEQQDIQQAMRIIFDTIERALVGTDYYECLRSLFRGSTIRYKTCRACGETAEHQQVFYDLQLQVKGASSVNEALLALTTAEGMEGDNAIYCDICQSKQDMWLGSRLNQLPGTLVLTLNRFDFDYQKFDRVKLNNYFEYQLELDLSGFVMPHPDPDYNKYELFGVLIHRGSAHGGHYLCFARDLLHETDWQGGLVQTAVQQARIKDGSKAADKQNQDKQYKLVDPNNKQLVQNWYQINDNIATAVNANKLTTKYQGSDSAYILFYRRKSLLVNKQKIALPAYFSQPIAQANKVMAKERQVYEFEKKHIIFNINGSDHKMKGSTTLNQFKQTYIAHGSSLVLQLEHNGLPYYPIQIINNDEVTYQPKETLITLEVPHESKWKSYQLLTPQYEQIKSVIGKGRLPFEVVLICDGENPKRIVVYSDENFLILRMKIEKIISIPYQNQIITLVTPYKQLILTENSTNDQIILPKIGIIHGAQLMIKSMAADEQDNKQEKKTTNESLICFVIQRDDVIGLKRFYFQKAKSLEQLLDYFINMQALKDNVKRRFRNLNGNRLYYSDHYANTLESFDFSEEMVRLRLERGEIPIKGDICVKIKMQSTLLKIQNLQQSSKFEKIFDPNTQILQVKEWVCTHYGLEISLHKLYLTDWMTEPVRSLTRQKLTLFEANFARQETLCLRDIYSPIGAELVHLQVFNTITGSPDNTIKEGIHVKIQEFKTVSQLKQLLIQTLQLKDVTNQKLRLRQIKRDYMFGTVWRDNQKSVKSVTINSNKIVYQILEEPQALTDDQIVLVLKRRNKEKRIYQNANQIIFDAGKIPNVEQLIEAVKAKFGENEIFLTKYFHYNFQWIELNRKNIEGLAKNKKNNNQKGKKPQQAKGKTEVVKTQQKVKKQEGNTEGKVQQKTKKQEGKGKNKKNGQEKGKEQKGNELKIEKSLQGGQKQIIKTQNAGNKPAQTNNVETKGKKQKKGGKNEQKQLLEECQNLRKAPILLKDGDILGWGISSQLSGDDLQTEQDLALRVQLKNQPVKYKGKQAGGFKLNVDF